MADGVGGWNRKGVDPGIFARELCQNVWEGFQEVRRNGSQIDLKEILIEAVAKTKAIGTSTFVMAHLDQEQALLKTLNLGDSGFLLVRPHKDGTYELIFRSKE